MLNWIITFFLLAIVSAAVGFGGMTGPMSEISKFMSAIFVVLFLASFIHSMADGHRPPVPPS